MNRISRLVVAALGSAAILSVAVAQRGPQTPQQQAEQAVKTRQGLFDVQGYAFGPVGAMLKEAPFDAAVVKKAAARLQVTAGMIAELFQPDTRKFQVTTKAKESVWSNKADFDKKATDLQTAVSGSRSGRRQRGPCGDSEGCQARWAARARVAMTISGKSEAAFDAASEIPTRRSRSADYMVLLDAAGAPANIKYTRPPLAAIAIAARHRSDPRMAWSAGTISPDFQPVTMAGTSLSFFANV
jgi:cytochrome c556